MQAPTVAALYVATRTPYAALGADCFDIDRDASTYTGDLPVVAHPPCRNWGKLKGFAKGDDKHCAWDALAQVRRCGGILEHPVGSTFFKEAGIDVPSEDGQCGYPDAFGGYVLRLAQWDMGHRGDKATLFYILGTEILPVLFERQGGVKYPVQNMSQRERLATPPAMAHWMMRVAELCRAPGSFAELLELHQVAPVRTPEGTPEELYAACRLANQVDQGEPLSGRLIDAAAEMLYSWTAEDLDGLEDRDLATAIGTCRELLCPPWC